MNDHDGYWVIFYIAWADLIFNGFYKILDSFHFTSAFILFCTSLKLWKNVLFCNYIYVP